MPSHANTNMLCRPCASRAAVRGCSAPRLRVERAVFAAATVQTHIIKEKIRTCQIVLDSQLRLKAKFKRSTSSRFSRC
eukprot:3696455-Pyramimonas_sp.AAC.1